MSTRENIRLIARTPFAYTCISIFFIELNIIKNTFNGALSQIPTLSKKSNGN